MPQANLIYAGGGTVGGGAVGGGAASAGDTCAVADSAVLEGAAAVSPRPLLEVSSPPFGGDVEVQVASSPCVLRFCPLLREAVASAPLDSRLGLSSDILAKVSLCRRTP